MTATMHLIKKELYLQKNNFLFAGILVILFIVISLLKISPLADIPYQSMTLKKVFEFLLDLTGFVLPCFLLPLMFGCSAASSETMYEVRPWQDSLPVSRKRAYILKVITTIVLVGGTVAMFFLAHNFLTHEAKPWSILAISFFMACVGLYSGSIADTALKALIIAVGLSSLVYLVAVMFAFYFSILDSLRLDIEWYIKVTVESLVFMIFSYYNYVRLHAAQMKQQFSTIRFGQIVIILIVAALFI